MGRVEKQWVMAAMLVGLFVVLQPMIRGAAGSTGPCELLGPCCGETGEPCGLGNQPGPTQCCGFTHWCSDWWGVGTCS